MCCRALRGRRVSSEGGSATSRAAAATLLLRKHFNTVSIQRRWHGSGRFMPRLRSRGRSGDTASGAHAAAGKTGICRSPLIRSGMSRRHAAARAHSRGAQVHVAGGLPRIGARVNSPASPLRFSSGGSARGTIGEKGGVGVSGQTQWRTLAGANE